MVALVSILAVAVALLTLLVAGLLRSHAEILRALQSLGVSLDPDASDQADRIPSPTGLTGTARPAGAPALDVRGVDPDGAAVTFAVAGVEQRTLLAFLSSTCLTCRGFWEAFADRRLAVPGNARLLVVTKGSEAESPGTIRKLAPANVHTVLSSDAWRDYNIPVAPYFVLVDGPSGSVTGEGAAATWDQVRDLMEQSLFDGRPQDRPSRVDSDLKAAGIEPGHSSLYPGRDE
jgi:hypothetical protein